MANPLYDVPGLGGYVAQQEINNRQNSRGLEDYALQQGILAKMQQQQQSQSELAQIQDAMVTSKSEDEAMQKLQRIGTPRAMKIMEDISQAKLRKAQEASALSSQTLHGVQAQQATQQMGQQQQQNAARQGLIQQLTQSQYGGETAPGGPKPQLFQNDQEAIAAMKQAESSGQPFRGDVNNPNVTKALAVASDPQRAIPELMRQMRPPQTPPEMTPYQRENLRLQEQRLNAPRPDRLVPMPDPSDPSRAIFGKPQEGMPAYAPGAGGILNNNLIRERQLAKSLEAATKPHLDVMNAYQRFNEIKATGDNSQANQILAQQFMQMSKTGQRVIPQKELERILGSGDLGNNWYGRAANMISQMAAGVRTPDIDKKLNDIADAMARASADRIGQEIQNTRARTPSGANTDNIVGKTPTIYGRFIISPSGKVYQFKNAAEAQAKLSEAASKVGE